MLNMVHIYIQNVRRCFATIYSFLMEGCVCACSLRMQYTSYKHHIRLIHQTQNRFTKVKEVCIVYVCRILHSKYLYNNIPKLKVLYKRTRKILCNYFGVLFAVCLPEHLLISRLIFFAVVFFPRKQNDVGKPASGV